MAHNESSPAEAPPSVLGTEYGYQPEAGEQQPQAATAVMDREHELQELTVSPAPQEPVRQEHAVVAVRPDKYKGVRRAASNQPSTNERQQLSRYDQDTRQWLAEVREQAYTEERQRSEARDLPPANIEVAAQKAAQIAVNEAMQARSGHHGQHRRPITANLARYQGQHRRVTPTQQVANAAGQGAAKAYRAARDWLTYSPEEWAARQSDARAEHAAETPRLAPGSIVPQADSRDGRVVHSKGELRNQRLTGALPEVAYSAGAAEAPSRETIPSASLDKDELLAELVKRGARTEEEILDELFAHRTVGGSSIYGWKIRKPRESNESNIGPVEHAVARELAQRVRNVSLLEQQVTDKFAPSTEVIEAMVYPDSDSRELTEHEIEVVRAIRERLVRMRSEKMPAGETMELPAALPDRTGAARRRWLSLKEQASRYVAQTKLFVGRAALHGAVWGGALVSPISPRPAETIVHGSSAHRKASEIYKQYNIDQPLRIYGPEELVGMAARWTFVKARLIASGALGRAHDYFTARDYETGRFSTAALRTAGAAATLVTAMATGYVYQKAVGQFPGSAYLAEVVEHAGGIVQRQRS